MKYKKAFLSILLIMGILLLAHKSTVTQVKNSLGISIVTPVTTMQGSTGRNDSLQQAKPGKKRTIQDLYRERDSAREAELKLPVHLQRIGRFAREVIQKMKDDGVTRANARAKHADSYSNGYIQVDKLGRIKVQLGVKNLQMNAVKKLTSLGVKIHLYTPQKGMPERAVVDYLKKSGVGILLNSDTDGGTLLCWVPFDAVEQVAKIKSFGGFNTIFENLSNVGVVTSKGDTVVNAYKARDYFNINGNNIKVGVISKGIRNWQSFAPPTGTDIPTLNVLYDDGDTTTREGIAMSEIVYDIAPGVQIDFSSIGGDPQSLSFSILNLLADGCKVIVDDAIFPYSEPAYEEGEASKTVDTVVKRGVVYFSACGNQGRTTYYDIYNPDISGLHQFSYLDTQDSMLVKNGVTIFAALQWPERWGKSNEDYTFGAYYGSFVGISGTDNHQGSTPADTFPHEFIQWKNSTGSNQTVHFQIGKHPDAQPNREVKLLVFVKDTTVLQWRNDAGIYGHASADSCISVATVNADNTDNPKSVASYSSHGTTRIYSYDSNGDPISSSEKNTPTLTGIDNVNTRVGQVYGEFYPFTGTSAAAPHVAGVAALMLSIDSTLTPAKIRNILSSTAVPVSGWGGAGLVDAYEAVVASLPAMNNRTFVAETTINSYLRLTGTTTLNTGVILHISAGKTVVIEGGLTGSASSKIDVGGTLILRGVNPQSASLVVKRSGGRVIIEKKPGSGPEILPKTQPTIPLATQNANIFDYNIYRIASGASDTLATNSTMLVDSSGVLDLLSSSNFVVQNTCSLRVKGNGIIKIPSGAQLRCSGTLLVEQGGTVQVGKGGTLRIETGGQMQLLTGGNGSVTVDSGGQVICYGIITASDTLYAKRNSSVIIQSGGQLTLNSGGTVVLDTSVQITNYGTTTINSGGILDTKKLSTVLTQNGGMGRINQGGLLKIWGDATSNNATIDCYGTLSTNGVINCDGSFVVRSGGKLRADSSSVTKLGYNGTLSCYGAIIAKGTATKKATFTSTNGSPTPGSWNKIYLLGGPDTLKNCRIKYAITGLYLYNSATDIIDSCTIDSCSYYGVYLDSDNGANTISNSTIQYNGGFGINMVSSNADFVRTAVTNNTSSGCYIFLSSPHISKSRFQGNGAYGLSISGSTSLPVFSPNGIDSGKNTIKLNGYPQLYITNGGNAYLGELITVKQCVCASQVPSIPSSVQSLCNPPCQWITYYYIHAGYNNIVTTSTSSGMLINNGTTNTVKARYNYWSTPGTSSIYGPVDTTSRLSDSVFTPAKNYPLVVREPDASTRWAEGSLDDPRPVPDSVLFYIQSLKETIVQNPDSSSSLALQLLYTFLGPNGTYQSANDVPWENFLSSVEDSTKSLPLKSLAAAYRVQGKMDRHQFTDAISLADNYLRDNLSNELWFFYQAQKLIAHLDLGDRTTARSILQSITNRGNQEDSLSLSMLSYLISNHPIELTSDSVVIISTRPTLNAKVHSPTTYSLEQNYPNPFNPVTKINYTLLDVQKVTLKVYNILGQEVKTLIDEVQISGYKTVSFDANKMPSGVYFYRLQAGKFSDVKKMMLLK